MIGNIHSIQSLGAVDGPACDTSYLCRAARCGASIAIIPILG